MSTRRTLIGVAAVILWLCLASPGVVVAQQEAEVLPACSDCHTEAEAFMGNPHARGTLTDGTVPSAVCESCHGDGTAHIEAGGDPSLIFLPVGFDGSQVCLQCHNLNDDQQSHRNSVHANSKTVNCLTCHSVHHAVTSEPHLLARKQLELCASCHSTKATAMRNKPFQHRIGRGGMECSSCHNPHGRIEDQALRETKAGEPICLSCHAEVRGPHVFPHAAMETGDSKQSCQNCHQVHGSNNPKQLKRANVFQLCLECHSPIVGTTLGSQPPSFHNINLPRYRHCTTCHVAVHGSNRSPSLMK
jgi:DmsE family decaheme c-type cytochrome